MAELRFADDDDLPRTLRRAREEREREMPLSLGDDPPFAASNHVHGQRDQYGYEYGAGSEGDRRVTVTRLRIPFFHLVFFFMKAVVAAIPALVLLTGLLWGMGQGLKVFYPDLRHFEILVRAPR